MSVTLHREDVKAVLRKRYRTMRVFAAKHGLTEQAVADCLRNRSRTAIHALAAEMGVDSAHLEIVSESKKLDDSAEGVTSHRLNGEAR